MILERELTVAEMLGWLQAEAGVRKVDLTLFPKDIEERTEQYYMPDGEERSNTFVIIRVRINEVSNPSKRSKIIGELQEAWNYREPRPAKLLHLIPSGVPQGVW